MKQSLIKMLAVGLFACSSVALASEEATNLGDINFPNSGSEEAQEPFLRGVKALHSFWFEEAEEAFRNAQEVDPTFALAYWGEAMSHNHPLWAEQDVAKARQVLSRLGKTRSERLTKAPTEREKMYLNAIETLYAGSDDKLTRDMAYERAMAKLAVAHPEDNEAQAFHALSMLGLVRRGDQGFTRQMKAGAKALKLFEEQPNHPGAAHYVIHSFDDPEHAPLALPAAERYAKIAPEAHHALHMPTHIFVQHGMWDRVAESNLSAFNASAKWVERKHLSETKKDFHSWQWRTYANLQRGVWDGALEGLSVVMDTAKSTQDTRLRQLHAQMKARYQVETHRFDEGPLPEASPEIGRYNAVASQLFAIGMGAAISGNVDKATDAADRLAKLRKSYEEMDKAYNAMSMSILEHEMRALVASANKDTASALEHAKKASEIEAKQDPPSGPTFPHKPSHELYGELLLEAGKTAEAMDAFETSLSRTPNRTYSLLGMARAAKQAGEMTVAAETYHKLKRILADADGSVPFLQEVRGFEATTDAAPQP